jgi:flagellar biosynthesis/type III secretory pathway protein FliH
MDKVIDKLIEKWTKDGKINKEKLSQIKVDLDDTLTEVYEGGLDDGYQDGHSDGYDEGYGEGFVAGKNKQK